MKLKGNLLTPNQNHQIGIGHTSAPIIGIQLRIRRGQHQVWKDGVIVFSGSRWDMRQWLVSVKTT